MEMDSKTISKAQVQAELLRFLRDQGEADLMFSWSPSSPKSPVPHQTKQSAQSAQPAKTAKPILKKAPTITFTLPKVDTSNKAKSLAEHFEKIKSCSNCRLHKNRENLVYGEGNPDADLFIIGEVSDFEESKTGIPLQGEAGNLYERILKAMTLSREKVYTTNLIKCPISVKRDPQPDESSACIEHLLYQIAVVQPKVILLSGRIPAQTFLKTKNSMKLLRNDWHKFADIPTIVSYNPKSIEINKNLKKTVWDDMQKIMTFLDIPIP